MAPSLILDHSDDDGELIAPTHTCCLPTFGPRTLVTELTERFPHRRTPILMKPGMAFPSASLPTTKPVIFGGTTPPPQELNFFEVYHPLEGTGRTS